MIKPCEIDKGRFRKFGKVYEGLLHCGHDFDAPQGTIVKAIDDGFVIRAEMIEGFGALNPVTEEQKKNTKGGAVIIKHIHKETGKCYYALYGHLTMTVHVNDVVIAGEIIGGIANFTNRGEVLPHLHFGIWDCEEPIVGKLGYDRELRCWTDPLKFLKDNNAT